MQFTPSQLSRIDAAFKQGAADASVALGKWLGVPSLITIESVNQQPMSAAPGLLGQTDDVVCFCVMNLTGSLSGYLVLSFDDASGLALADLLLKRPTGSSTEWDEVAQSAALETHNIVGCAYLNTPAQQIWSDSVQDRELIPSPPSFFRDFAESLLQSVLMDQAVGSD